jgi:hypothetical protein
MGDRTECGREYVQVADATTPRADKWARESGMVFEADNTAFLHFVRPLQPNWGLSNHFVS